MWIQTNQLQRIDSALEAGRAEDIDKLIADILRSGGSELSTSNGCVVCRRELVRSELPAGLVAFTCSAGHGAWVAPETLEALHRLSPEPAARRSRSRVRLLAALLVAWAAVLVAGVGFNAIPLPGGTSAKPMPVPERRYLNELVAILGQGASHRRDVEGVLQSRSELETYRVVYDIYRQRQGDVLARLRRLDVPERLRPVHERIIRATEQQIAFYGAFTEARVRGDAKDLAQMLSHPALRSSDYELHAAWDQIRGLYPTLDPGVSQVIEGALCQFDVI
jgi:hypothetical protein